MEAQHSPPGSQHLRAVFYERPRDQVGRDRPSRPTASLVRLLCEQAGLEKALQAHGFLAVCLRVSTQTRPLWPMGLSFLGSPEIRS